MNEEKEPYSMTDLDYATIDPHLQMAKAALPYLNIPGQRIISMMIRMREMQNTMRLFQEHEDGMLGICSLDHDATSPFDMIQAMRPFATPQEQDMIDNLQMTIQMMQQFMHNT